MLYVAVRMGWQLGSAFSPVALIKDAPKRLDEWRAWCISRGLVGRSTWDDLLTWLVANPHPRYFSV
jgi:hypothetical protein